MSYKVTGTKGSKTESHVMDKWDVMDYVERLIACGYKVKIEAA